MRAANLVLGLVLLLSACALPFDRAAETPLSSVRSNYITLYSGVPLFLGYTASAVVVADGLAVTNRHVVEASSRIQGYVAGRGLIPVEVMAVSHRMDLALLRIPPGIGRPLVAAPGRTGEAVWLMGTPMPFADPVVAGTVETVSGWSCPEEDGTTRCPHRQMGLLIRADGAPGYSGGPVVDPQGRLVGVSQGVFLTAVDARGRTIQDGATRIFAYRIADVLAEVARLRSAGEQTGAASFVRPG